MADGVQWNMTSDFTGFHCDREAITRGREAIKLEFDSWTAPPCKFMKACDNGKVPTRILTQMAIKVDEEESCLFNAMADRLGDSYLDLVALEPLPTANKEEQEKARKAQEAWIQVNAEKVLGNAATSDCSIHDKCCPVLLPPRPKQPSRQHEPKEFRELRGNIAGTPCLAWCRLGSHGRFAHASERDHAIWLATRQQAAILELEDFVFC